MGTRADFYVGLGKDAEWLGSIPCDGFPSSVDSSIKLAITEESFRAAVTKTISTNRGTTPDMGWPWPWDNGALTDYSYFFADEKVVATHFGYNLFDPSFEEPDVDRSDGRKIVEFPDMAARKHVAYGPRSGLIVLR